MFGEELAQLLFGASGGPARDPTPVTLPPNPKLLGELKTERHKNTCKYRD